MSYFLTIGPVGLNSPPLTLYCSATCLEHPDYRIQEYFELTIDIRNREAY